jgi:hypothetical protein
MATITTFTGLLALSLRATTPTFYHSVQGVIGGLALLSAVLFLYFSPFEASSAWKAPVTAGMFFLTCLSATMNAVLYEGRGGGQGTLQLSGTAMLLLGLTPLVFALGLLLTLLVSWWRSLFLILVDPEAAPPAKIPGGKGAAAPTPGAGAVQQGEEEAAAAACAHPQEGGKGVAWKDNPLQPPWQQHKQDVGAEGSSAVRVRLAARYLHERDALPPGWEYMPEGERAPGAAGSSWPWVSPSGQRHPQDPREDAAAYMAHTLAAWEAGEDVLAMVPKGLVESVEARAAKMQDADELPPGWDWVLGEDGTVCFLNAQGERVEEDPRDASLLAYQEEVAAALGYLSLARGGAGRGAQKRK